MTGGAKRVGDAANGIPRYLSTVTVAPASSVGVPTTAPESIVTVGAAELAELAALAGAASPTMQKANAATKKCSNAYIVLKKQESKRMTNWRLATMAGSRFGHGGFL